MRSLLILNVITVALTVNALPLFPTDLLKKMKHQASISDTPSSSPIPCYCLARSYHP